MMASTSAAALLGKIDSRCSRDAWDIAKARFLEGLDEKEKVAFHDATAENIFYAASNVEREDQRESKTRSLFAKLQPLVSAVEDYGKAMDTFSNITPLYLAPIWGSIRVMLVIASNHGRFYTRAIDTFGHIGDILPRLRDYQRIFDLEKHQRFTQSLSAAYLDIISLCTEFKTLLRTQKESTVKRIFQPISPALNAHLEDAILRFRRHRRAVEKEAELCHMIEEKESRNLVVRNHAAAEARERENRQRILLSLLSKTDNESKHRRMQRIRHKGTGGWLKASDEFKAWSSCTTHAVMCLYGIPGCGKSVLMSSLIDDMLVDDGSNSKGDIIFYYCDHADKRTLDPVNIFSSLALQLLSRRGGLPTGILAILESVCQDSATADLEDIVRLLLKSMEKIISPIIVLDGLDEVNEVNRKIIFHNLNRLVSQASTSVVKIIIASREDTTYLTQVSHASSFKVRAGVETVTGDIDCFVKYAIRDLISRNELVIGDSALKEEIFVALSRGAKGMFLWVKFQLDDLCRAETDSSIREVLRNLPLDLSETYDRLLARIGVGEQRKYVKRMFEWIICAKRPLEVEELRQAIAFSIDDYYFDPGKIPNDLGRLARICGNLIVIEDEDDSVQIAHYTVEQYLLAEKYHNTSFFHFNKEQANLRVGQVCVAYLSFSDFELQLTRYDDNHTSTFAALEDVVRTESMLPPRSPPSKLVKVLKRFRGNPDTPTGIPFDQYIHSSKWRKPAASLNTKYHLLSYLVENWLHHNTGIQIKGESSRHQALFAHLALEKNFSFDLRPWDSIPFRLEGTSDVLKIGWAVSTNHIPLLHAVSEHIGENCVANYFERASTAFTLFASRSAEAGAQSLRKFSGRSTNNWPNPEDWECWLCRCLLIASDNSFTDILTLSFWDWTTHGFGNQKNAEWNQLQLILIGNLILHAAFHERLSTVECLAKITLNWPFQMRRELWTTTKTVDDAANAFESAFASQSEHLMELLGLAGCQASASFKERILRGSSLRVAFAAPDVLKIRCLLRIFGATTSSFLNVPSRIYYARTRAAADASAFSYLVEQAKVSSACRSASLETHWISALKDASIDDQINVLLAAGRIPSLQPENTWLLMNAIIENKSLRLTLLVKACVPLSYSIDFKHFEGTDPIIFTLRKAVTPEVFVSPLCCAVIFERHQMIKELLVAGAPVNAHGSSSGLAPLHFAAMADSLEGFKCLESHGADLGLKDTTGRNMIDMVIATKLVGNMWRPDKSLFYYLIKHHESYSHYSWGAQLKALYLSSPRSIALRDAGLLDCPGDKQ